MSTAASPAPRLFTPSSHASSGHRKLAGSMGKLHIYLHNISTYHNKYLVCISAGKLHKKWRSTSDFDPAPALSVYRKNTTGAAAVTGSSLRNRRPSVTLCFHIDIDTCCVWLS